MPIAVLASLGQQKQRSDLVFDVIRDNIISGQFASGTWLRQEELASQLGVSPTPVRQALERLVADGLAERVPYRGVRVPSVSHEEVAEVCALRLLLEPIIVRLAAKNIPGSTLLGLSTLLDQAEALCTLDQMGSRRDINRRFHKTISEECGSPLLGRLHEMVWNRFPDWMLYEGMFRKPETRELRLSREIGEHRQLLAILARRDEELAEKSAFEYLRGFSEEIVDLLGIPTEVLEEKQRKLWPHGSPRD